MDNNGTFIQQVFNSLIQYKPKLGLYLADEGDEDFDIRELSNIIAKSFPWPVGIEIRRLLSANMERNDRSRLDQIFKTIERTQQYLSFVLIIQLLEESLKKEIEIPENFKKEFTKRFSTLTMGNFTWLIRSISNLFKENDIEPFMVEVNDVFTKEFFKSLEFWVPERNEIGHYQINLTEEEIEVRCHEYLKKLESILCKLSFLIKYPLVTITDIQLIKPKREQEQYNHKMLLLNSSSSNFMGKNRDFDKFTDTHAVLLVKNLNNAPDQFLNLSPLIIDTHFEKMESREKLTKLKKDVYLYSKWDQNNNCIHYVGTEATEKTDMRLVSFYNQLLKEFNEILNAFSLEEVSHA